MAWWFLVDLGVLAVSLVASYYLRPEIERQKAAELDDFNVPRAEEGDAVALCYGTCRLQSPSVVQFNLNSSVPIDPSAVAAGYRYWIFMRMLLCRTNARVGIDSPQAQLVSFYVGDKSAALDGPDSLLPGNPDSAGNASFQIDEESGGASEGRIAGTIVFYDGRWDGLRHSVDVQRTDEAAAFPYRGYATLLLTAFYVEAPNLPPFSPVIFNPCVIPGYESQTGPISGATTTSDCNPAAVLYDLLTNPWGGIGNDSSIVDVTSFVDAAATLEDEQHGCSMLVTKPNEARTVIAEVLRQIDGVLYQDFDSNRYVLKLIREDYDPLTLPEYTISNVLEAPEMPSTLWSETYNQVRVVFTDPGSSYRQSTAMEQDLAGIAINGGKVRSQEIHFPGCRNPDLAQRLAARELNFFSRPIYTIRLVVNRQGWNLKPGDPFRFTWSDWGGLTVIFRVTQIDLGELDSGRITITGVQDRFSIVGTVFDPPIIDTLTDPPPTPTPVIDRLVTECPRWIQVQAYDQGLVNNPDAQRSYALARPEGSDSRYRLDTALNAADEASDLGGRAFPTTFTLAASYAKSVGPYDTVTGILIENLDGDLSSATATQIREEGRNLFALWDADGHHEILAFEAAADLGGGSYQLQNVWRGLLDTVPQDWSGGAAGAILPGTNGVSAMGKLVLRYGATVATHLPAASGSTWTPSAFSPVDGFTAASRVLHPVRAANLLVDGSQTPDDLEDGGVPFVFTIRNRTTATVSRGDDAAESTEAGQTYDAVAYKGTGSQVVLAAGHTSSATNQLALGKIGHGSLEVGIDTKRTVTLPDGSSVSLRGWQVPTVPLVAHHWRNLLKNGDFSGYSGTGGMDGWTTVGGTPQAASATPPGNAGYYARGLAGAGTTTFQQDVDVSGYPAHLLTAELDFLARKLADSVAPDDTVTVTLYALDSGGSTVSSTTYGPASPSVWTHQNLELTLLDMTVTTLRVRVALTTTTSSGPDNDADAGVALMRLRLGQISAQLLTNPSFESGGGSTTGWTATSGTWQVLSTAYESTYYVRPNDGASAQLRQTVSVPTGHELAVAVLECARSNDDADDTGEVVLEALDGGGSVVATATTGAEAFAFSGSPVWARRRLTLTIPATATQLRVTLNATRVTGTPLNAIFDDFDLRTHKHLDPDQEQTWSWSEPATQYLPRSAMEWKFRWPDVDAPDYALYDGTANGKLGIEPLLSSNGTASFFGGKCIAYDGTNRSTTAFECYDAGAGASIATNPTGTAFCNFASADSFTVLVFVKVRPDAPLGDGFGICGRMADGIGWEIRLTDTDGFPMVRVTGAGGSASVIGGTTVADGALHAIALVYNGGANTLRLITTAGTSSTSTAAIGELSTTTPGKFRVMFAGESEAVSFQGQVARVYIWRSAMATADVQSLMTYADLGDLTSQGRTGVVACLVGTDTAGVVVDSSPADRPAILFDDASDRFGLLSLPAVHNLATASTIADTGTVTPNAAADPTGFYEALTITGNDSEGRSFGDITFGTSGTVYVQWMAKADSAHDACAVLLDSIGGEEARQTYSLTTSWQVFTWPANWSGGIDGTGQVMFTGSDDGTDQTIYLSPLVCISLLPSYPGAFPVGDPGATTPLLSVALTNQINREGEVVVEVASTDADACLVDLHNGTNDNDRRTITFNSDATTPQVKSDHCNSTGTNNTNAQISPTAIDPTAPWEARLRWNRAGTLDGNTYMAVVRATQGATVEQDPGRNTAWTASTTAVSKLELGHKADGTEVMTGVVFAAEVRAREEKLDPP